MRYHSTDWLPAQLLETYHELAPIGSDEIVAAFRGSDTATGRDVVLKVLSPELSASPRAVARFKEEAYAAAKLVHPNIVKFQTVDEAAGFPYFVTASIPAESLRAKLRRDRVFPLQTVRAIAAQVGAALRYAHQHGVMHRGLTPDRILVTKAGHVHVTDFGIAAAGHTFSLAQLGMVMGRPEYLPPESINGTFTTQSDLYALAVIIYELYTGSVPFHDDDPLTTLRRQANERPQLPSEQGIAVEPAFERALLKALSKQPGERFSDVGSMLRALGAGSVAASGTSVGTDRHTDADPMASRSAREDRAGIAPPLPKAGEVDEFDDDDQQSRTGDTYRDRQDVRQQLRALVPTGTVPLVALLLTVAVVTGFLTASLRSLSGGQIEQADDTLAGVLTPTVVSSATSLSSTRVTFDAEEPAARIVTAPTETVVLSATEPTGAPSATPTQQVLATATGMSSPLPTEIPPTAITTAGVAEPDDTAAPVRALTVLNVRSGPGTTFSVSGALQSGETMTVLGQNSDGGWLYVATSAGTEGWVTREFTTFDASAPIRPEPTQPATPSPLVVATPSSTPVPPASPTLTTDATVQYDAPLLEVPTEGATRVAPINFQWSWNGTLAENEYFDVRVWQEGEPHLGIAWTKVPQLRLETTTLRGTYRWTVVVVRGENGQWQADLSPEAPPRMLSVVAPDASGGEANPAPQPTQPPEPTSPPQPAPSPTR